jgi:hypothetical protein
MMVSFVGCPLIGRPTLPGSLAKRAGDNCFENEMTYEDFTKAATSKPAFSREWASRELAHNPASHG